MLELKPCPFCGGHAKLWSVTRTDACITDGTIGQPGTSYGVITFCLPSCPYGNAAARAYGVLGPIHYTSAEAAANAWNRRRTDE